MAMVIILGLTFLLVAAARPLLFRSQKTGRSDAARRSRLVSEARRADRRINQEHQQARRAMNDAAGQSWRNLTD